MHMQELSLTKPLLYFLLDQAAHTPKFQNKFILIGVFQLVNDLLTIDA